MVRLSGQLPAQKIRGVLFEPANQCGIESLHADGSRIAADQFQRFFAQARSLTVVPTLEFQHHRQTAHRIERFGQERDPLLRAGKPIAGKLLQRQFFHFPVFTAESQQ